MFARLTTLALLAMVVAGCSRDAERAAILDAIAECGLSKDAKLFERKDGSNPFVVDLQLEGRAFEEASFCIGNRMKALGYDAPGTAGGSGDYTPRPRRPTDPPPPQINAG